jgi:hypothetical protein
MQETKTRTEKILNWHKTGLPIYRIAKIFETTISEIARIIAMNKKPLLENSWGTPGVYAGEKFKVQIRRNAPPLVFFLFQNSWLFYGFYLRSQPTGTEIDDLVKRAKL